MSAFYIFHTTINDQSKFLTYAKSVPATLTPFEGEVVTRGAVAEIVKGEHGHKIVAVLRFPDQEKAASWYKSEAYQALVPNRNEAANMIAIRYNEL